MTTSTPSVLATDLPTDLLRLVREHYDNRHYQDCLDLLESYDCATNAKALGLKGLALAQLGQDQAALEIANAALALEPDVEILMLITNLLINAHEYALALRHLELQIKMEGTPSLDILVWRKTLKARLCDWDNYAELDAQLVDMLADGHACRYPFHILNLPGPASIQLVSNVRAAHLFYSQHYEAAFPVRPLLSMPARPRIGYLSNDFYNHATAFLLSGVLEAHDRERFEIVGITWGSANRQSDEFKERTFAQFDEWIDIENLSNAEAAQRIHDADIDILVDLKGYTRDNRVDILAFRPAPIQVNYLGFPGTMGTPFHDYIVADPFLIPESMRHYYTEFIAYLPDSYQPNDQRRPVCPVSTSRAEHGLPENNFVFCSFNQSYKIHPELFSLWCEILKAVPDSVLWLWLDTEQARFNLQRSAEAHGIAPERLVFATAIPNDRHLERLRHADLFLDTFPINAHTTASDALFAGVPVLTCAGETFASRVAGSLLSAIPAPDLICNDFSEYFHKAVAYASDRAAAAATKQQLKSMICDTPLYQTERYTRHLEQAYSTMLLNHINQQHGDFSVSH
ncbi:hypothetical protein OL229_13770 [Neisseriaceae bacterium JH1-16]|nr:hypothetical protein [Neisseriaceae bacterium JH1-16]